MGDPFSVIASTVSVADVCFRLIKYLKDVHAASSKIGDDIHGLVHEVVALEEINKSIQKTFQDDIRLDPSTEKVDNISGLWKHIVQSLRDCQRVIERLDGLVRDIYGAKGPAVSNVRDAFAKSHRKRSAEADLRRCRDELSTYQGGLNILLTTITLYNARDSQDANVRSFDDLSRNLQSLDRGLHSQIASLQLSIDESGSKSQKDLATLSALKDLRGSIDSAAAAITAVSANRHFDIPQPVSSIFTGRENYLETLRNDFIAPPGFRRDHKQRRFVVYGLGGSGKTQFCSKFAEDNRDSFWGVFWVDASNPESIKRTFAHIAKIAEVDLNENAALHWLSNIEQRWLLIIDNADDPNISLERYFPKGNRGHILVTTRNPGLKIHGNVGSGFFDFGGLDFNDANHLLLKAAQQPLPWDSSCATSASAITKALGFLALAITHAGAVIRDGLCSLKNYLSFYERSWQRVRNANRPNSQMGDDTTQHMHIYTSWEICYQRIESKGTQTSRDAIQLLNTFAFFHWENIPHDIFTRAVQNGSLEADQEATNKQTDLEQRKANGVTLSQRIKALNLAFLHFLMKSRSPLALPNAIRDARQSGSSDEFDDRIRFALRELSRMSLITHNELNDSYSMHPIVHRWARERPGMRIAEQALWCEVALNLSAASILLPPLGSRAKDEAFNRDLLPHLVSASSNSKSIKRRMAHRRQLSWTNWLLPRTTIDPQRAGMYAKFSLVYAQCGYWTNAEGLLTEVRDYTQRVLGLENEKTRRVTLFLSEVYWNLGRGADAAKLQRGVLQVCKDCLPPDHPDTLRVKDRLGQTLWQQGRYTEALKLQEEAVEGLERILSKSHEDTLTAIDNLARTVEKFWERHHFERAYNLHSTAIKGMEAVHGPDHPRTLIARESFARVSLQLGGNLIPKAHTIMLEVLEKRKSIFGKEHPYTLLAMVNTAIAKCALGEVNEAEELIRFGLPIAERNLGPDHIGTLFGRHSLASVLLQQHRLKEAEELLVDVSERQKHMSSQRGDYHPDRLGTLIELAKCYRLLGNIERSIQVCDEALEGFDAISVKVHPLARDLRAARKMMADHQSSIERGEEGNPKICAISSGPYQPYSVF